MASLLVIEGPGSGQHFPLTLDRVSIGREDTCTFQILDQHISRQHLQVKWDAGLNRHIAGDYRSANGVFVNGAQILLDTPLADGDKVRIGQSILIYLAVDHPDAASATAAAKKMGEWKRSTLMHKP